MSLQQDLSRAYCDRAMDVFLMMQTCAQGRGLAFPVVRSESLLRFLQFPHEKQHKFVESLERFARIFRVQMEVADDFLELSVQDEFDCLNTVEEHFGVRIGQDISSKISKGDIIEIYDLEAIQIYRNLNFFRTTNYNLLDIAAHTWMELWDRSSLVQERIVLAVEKAMISADDTAIPFDVPVHLLKERAFGMTQALAIHLKYVAPVRSQAGDLFGFMTVMEAHPVAEGPEADKIGFV